MYLPDYAVKAVEIMQKNGYNIYPVGGCVRNHILGLIPDDYDMTTNALPSQVLDVFNEYNTFDSGLKHGTVSVVIDKQVVEITTHRTETSYTDNRHPDKVIFTSELTEDLRRRDFTMNAIAYDPAADSFIDPYGGIKDIGDRLIRAVGDPVERFSEDGLRILRALRFSSVLDFEIEEYTALAIHKCRELLKNISPERIYTEFTKLLCGSNVRNVLSEYYDVIAVFIPEILPMVGFDQQNPHHCYDVYEHTLVAVEAVEADPILRWTMFLHDTGKPETFFEDERGGHFYRHYKYSADIAEKVLSRLRASNDTVSKVTTLVYHHDSVIPETSRSVKRLLMKLGYDMTMLLFKVNCADAKGQAPFQLEERLLHIEKLKTITNEVISANDCFSLKDMNISGKDIIALGVLPGKRIGEILNILLNEVIDGEIENVKETLIERASELK
ncbi:MAG: CCA tRNA nucleotidyltransferase [Clostridia bacterium]|nr:CCA tRNA nucleotidyltransferase [Clostridia bacterium]